MIITPLLVGIIASRPVWSHLLLGAGWLLGYFCFFATSLWLKSRFKPRYLPPVRTYALLTAGVGVPLLILNPALLWWAPAFTPALAVGWYAAWQRDERSLLSGLATVCAAMLMAPVAFHLGGGDDWGRIWTVTAVLFAYFGGTVFYVKSAIRERGSENFLAWSVAWHAAATVACSVISPWLMLIFGGLTIRSAVVPPRGWSPKQLGIGEIAATAVVALAVLALV